MDSNFISAQVNFCIASAVGEVTALKQFQLSVKIISDCSSQISLHNWSTKVTL